MRIQKRYVVLLFALSLFLINSIYVFADPCDNIGYECTTCTTPKTWTCTEIATCNGNVGNPSDTFSYCIADWINTCAAHDCGCSVDESQKTYYNDSDGDGYGNSSVTYYGCNPPAKYILTGGDCDDNNINIWQMVNYFPDTDYDNHGCGSSTSVCSGSGPPSGYSDNNTDCDCNNPNKWRLGFAYYDADLDDYGCGSLTGACYGEIFPPENYTMTPNDCDCNVFSCNTDCSTSRYLDTDQDGFCDDSAVSHRACDAGSYYNVSDPALCTDCANADPSIWRLGDFYVDADNDTYGVNPLITDICYGLQEPPDYYSFNNLDCDDSVKSCNTDCDTFAYNDSDGDGFGNATVPHRVCDAPAGYVLNNTDCDDSVPSCNTDCSTLSYLDTDQDGFCDDPAVSHRECDAGSYYNVSDPALCTDCSNDDPSTWRSGNFCANNDGDNYGILPLSNVCYGASDPPSGYSYSCIDCDDTVPNTFGVGNFVVKYKGSTVAAIDNYGVLAITGSIYEQNPITGLPPSFTVKDSSSNTVSAITNLGDLYSVLGVTNMFNNAITPTASKDLLIRRDGQNVALFTENGEVKVRCVMSNFSFLGTPLG